MRKQLTALVGAAAGLAALGATAGPAAAWHSYRWYADYAPLYRPCCGAVYGPPVVYVVPPAYAYYPRPLYRAGRIKRGARQGASIIPFCSQLPEIGGNRRAPALAQRKSDRLLWTSPTRGLEMIVLLSPSSNAFQETAYGDVSSRKSRAAIALW